MRAEQSDKRISKSPLLITGRLFLALVFSAGATYNLFVTLREPDKELGLLIELSPLKFINEIASRILMPHATMFIIMIILFEAAIAVSVFLPVTARLRAYVAALVFFLVLIPLIGWYALTNLIWALPALVLLNVDRRRVAMRYA